MRRLSLMILFTLCLFLLLSCNKSKPSISFGEAGVLAAQAQTKEAGSIRVPAPAGTKAALCVGWQAKGENGTIFLPIGATYTYEAGESKSFTPVYLHFKTDFAASAILTDTESGICFTTTVNKADWNVLAAAATSIARGTLVLPTTEAQALRTPFTHEVLASLSVELRVTDIPADTWSAEGDDTFTFSAPFTSISESDYTQNYTALGYVKITYTDGSERYAYAGYGEGGMPSVAFYSFPEAVRKFLSLTTSGSATLDITAKNGGLCFTTSIPKEQWNALVNTSGTLTRGTLIFPAADLEAIGGVLTHAALENAGKTAVDIPSTTWLGGTASETLLFGATHTQLSALQRTIPYTAVGYIRITHPDGAITYIYASFENNTPPQVNVRALASIALHDMSATESEYYQYPVPGGFSPYTEQERTKLDELTKLPVLLISDTSVKCKRRLDDSYLAIYNERIVSDSAEFAADWNDIWQALIALFSDNPQELFRYGGGSALIITTKNGEPLTADNIGPIEIDLGSRMGKITTYVFVDGALVIPYALYSKPY